ncbi:exodeoxyribonuclease III [bacterium]|nr:exodeoxyribonuclease III [bacterium]|tara:strand:+ start:8426 stop:9223 length:798 start_codon:yes stop_codon:yes gene_type:complete
MRIVSWNVNGIRAVDRKGLFMPMIRELRPDVLCLQETKAQQHQSPIDLPDYEEFWNSAERKGYSGTAIFTKRKPLSVSYDLPEDVTRKHSLSSDAYGELNREGRVLTIEFPEVFIVTVYTPNAKDDLSRLELRYKHWDPAFLDYCVTLQNKKPVIFCGDLNVAHKEIDLARPKENEGNKGFTKEEREGADNIVEEGFIDTLRMFETGGEQYTWWSPWSGARERNVGWRIDYIFVSAQLEERVESAAIHPDIYGSDHCPVSADINL